MTRTTGHATEETFETAVIDLARLARDPVRPRTAENAVGRVLEALDRHCHDTEGRGGMFEAILSESPHLGRNVERLRDEHDAVRAQAGRLWAALARERKAGHDAIETTLITRIGILADECDRHHRHLADVVHEAFVAETGESD